MNKDVYCDKICSACVFCPDQKPYSACRICELVESATIKGRCTSTKCKNFKHK